MIQFDRYLIPLYTSNELDIAIESFSIACESDLADIMDRASDAKAKIEKGQRQNDRELIQDGKQEAVELKSELEEMDKKTTDSSKKSKIKTALKIILGILAVVGVGIGITWLHGKNLRDNMTLGELFTNGTYDIKDKGYRVVQVSSDEMMSNKSLIEHSRKAFAEPWVKEVVFVPTDLSNVKIGELRKNNYSDQIQIVTRN